MRKFGAQSIVEMLSMYSWAVLIISIFIAVAFILSGSPSGQPAVPAVCTIQPLFPCLDSTIGQASNNKIPFYMTFINGLQNPMYFPSANSFNLTTTGIGVSGTKSTEGVCTPQFVEPGAQIICNANVIGGFGPAAGTKVDVLFSFTYELCSKNAQSSCAPALYTTTGYATQTVSSTNIVFTSTSSSATTTSTSTTTSSTTTSTTTSSTTTTASQYYLTENSVPWCTGGYGGKLTQNSCPALTPGSNTFPSGNILTLGESVLIGTFIKWIGSGSGSYSGTSTSPTVTMNSNIIETAVFNTTNTAYVTGISIAGFSEPYGITINSAGTVAYVVNNCNNQIVELNTLTDQIIGYFNLSSAGCGNAWPYDIAINPSGTVAYVPFELDTVASNLNLVTNTVVGTFSVGSGSSLDPMGVAFSPGGTFAYVMTYGQSIAEINTATNTLVSDFGPSTYFGEVAFTPDGKYAYATGGTSGGVYQINPSSSTVTNTISVGSYPSDVAISPNGKYAYVVDQSNGDFYSINTTTATITNTVSFPNSDCANCYGDGVAVNNAGTYAYVTNENGGSSSSVSIISLVTNTVVDTITTPDPGPEQLVYASIPNALFITMFNHETGSTVDEILLGTGGGPPTTPYYVPITLTNNQPSATANTYQQLISFPPSAYSAYESPDLGNLRFYLGAAPGAANTVLNSWCQANCTSSTSGNTIFWVDIPYSIAGGGGSNTINMEFLPTSVDYNGVEAGEAAQWGPAVHDNGATVFSTYYNFAANALGGSLPAGWSSDANAVLSYQPLYLGIETAGTFAGIYKTAVTAENTLGQALEAYAQLTEWPTGFNMGFILSGTTAPKGACYEGGAGVDTYEAAYAKCTNGVAVNRGGTVDFSNPHWYTSILTTQGATTNDLAYVDYSFPGTVQFGNVVTYPSSRFNYLDVMTINTVAYTQLYIMRSRVSPTANNIMPTASFGSVV